MHLYSLFNNHTGNIIHKWPHYFPVYERYMNDFVNKSVVIYEIGVNDGGSLLMWRDFLGPMAKIIGFDINPACAGKISDNQCFVRIGDQSDPQFLLNIIKEFGAPDIVLDDGSHKQKDMLNTFNFLFPYVNNNGVYIVEDTHCCYWERWGGGFRKGDSFIEQSKHLIDALNAYHIRDDAPEDIKNNFLKLTKVLYSISYYDSMVVFEKKLHEKPYHIKRGGKKA